MDMIEAIRIALADGATMEQKVAGAQACRTMAATLEADIGGVAPPQPLAGVSLEQLEPLAERLSALVAAARAASGSRWARNVGRSSPIAFVPPAAPSRKRRSSPELSPKAVATAPAVTTEACAPEATTRVPPVIKVLAQILVRLALEEEGVLTPQPEQEDRRQHRRDAKAPRRRQRGGVE